MPAQARRLLKIPKSSGQYLKARIRARLGTTNRAPHR
jgi:hypothetical protein